MDPTRALLLGVVVPAVVAGAVLVAAGLARSRVLAALAVALGFAAGYVAIDGWPDVPPHEAKQWLPIVAAAGVVAAFAEARGRAAGLVARALASAALPVALLWLLASVWSDAGGWAWIAALAAGTFVVWTAADGLARAAHPRMLLAALWIAAAASAVAIGLSGSALLGQCGGALAATLGAALVLTVWAPAREIAPGVVAPVALLLAALCIEGRFFAELPLASMALLAGTPVVARLAYAPPFGCCATGKGAVLRLAATLAPAAAAVAIAYSASPPLE